MVRRFEAVIIYINQIYRCIQRIKSREMMELGLKGTDVMCLFNLMRNNDGLTSAQLSILCMEDKAAVSRAVSRLSGNGLITLEDSGDKRRYRSKIKLSDKGRRTAEEMEILIENAVMKGGEGLTEQERVLFYKALETISRNLQNMCGNEGD